MTVEIVAMILLLGLALYACWKWDQEKTRREALEWQISVLKERLSSRRLESDE